MTVLLLLLLVISFVRFISSYYDCCWFGFFIHKNATRINKQQSFISWILCGFTVELFYLKYITVFFSFLEFYQKENKFFECNQGKKQHEWCDEFEKEWRLTIWLIPFLWSEREWERERDDKCTHARDRWSGSTSDRTEHNDRLTE